MFINLFRDTNHFPIYKPLSQTVSIVLILLPIEINFSLKFSLKLVKLYRFR
jgi:hypothetical protein